ncbi:hypothetical protein NDU88_001743 [Pleurodeles waltl]|uniref:Uncharacterized protein n=1 Tax=Pleurodeles waltl TaxID=8319 RepID=A0AAV7P4V5_PLEWA|nr:hypothetical protein NDU88_001743 [Pleurodeles waltl]
MLSLVASVLGSLISAAPAIRPPDPTVFTRHSIPFPNPSDRVHLISAAPAIRPPDPTIFTRHSIPFPNPSDRVQ